ncbi:MAG: arylsulfatase [Eubacterium sp.]|nr:arylsulfatase [Eubacterium sp.]
MSVGYNNSPTTGHANVPADFDGYAGITLEDSRMHYRETDNAGRNNTNGNNKKTNVVYIVLDDVGFAQLEGFGSDIHTPNIKSLGDGGLRYNNFHTTAICSATRASLLTGANHHAVGVATVIDTATGFPNGIGHLDPQYATIAQILKENGYATFAVGKWHLAPLEDASDQGPFDNWPLSKGFDKFYGFMEGYTDQYTPSLIQDNSAVMPPKFSGGHRKSAARAASETSGDSTYSIEGNYHLSEDLADHAIHYLFQQTNSHSEQPFFLYLAFGAGHAPHQVPQKYIDEYKGKFDRGWDVVREDWFNRQRELGIVPEDAVLTDRNQFAEKWDDLTEDQKKVYAKYMEVYAGFLTHTDEQIGRVLDYLEKIGERENTVIVLLSDNGASAEGGRHGRVSDESTLVLGEDDEELEFGLQHVDELGSYSTGPHYPIGWANAGNTPFKWYKSWVYAGGVKDPLIVSYPAGITEKGGIRSQYHHVSDITPTILDILGIRKPDIVNGVAQKPITGTSFKYTFNDADAPTQKPIQYYEQTGNRGIWKDGWKAITNHLMVSNYEDDEWELYHVDEDYSEDDNVAELFPDKLEELKNLWFVEAGKNNVFPLGTGAYIVRSEEQKKSDAAAMKLMLQEEKYSYKGIIEPFRTGRSLLFNQRSNEIRIELDHKRSYEGTLYAGGMRLAGYTLFIKNNRLCYTYNAALRAYYRAVTDELPEGKLDIRVVTEVPIADSENTSTGQENPFGVANAGPRGYVSLYVNGKKQAETVIEKFWFGLEVNFSVKDGNQSSVDPENDFPFEYPGEIDRIDFLASPAEIDTKELLDEYFQID